MADQKQDSKRTYVVLVEKQDRTPTTVGQLLPEYATAGKYEAGSAEGAMRAAVDKLGAGGKLPEEGMLIAVPLGNWTQLPYALETQTVKHLKFGKDAAPKTPAATGAPGQA